MKKYSEFNNKRQLKQIIMSVLFIAVITLGWKYPLLGYFIPLCMIIGIGIGFFRGRKWCDWMCPRGSFYDFLIKFLSPQKQIPKIIKTMRLRIVLLSILMIIMVINLIKLWPDFYKIGKLFIVLLTVTTSLGIILSIFFHQRVWCYICPVGTLSNLAGKNRHSLRIDKKLCNKCALCAKVCPMQLSPFNIECDEKLNNPDCLKCGLCIRACPKKALKKGVV